ncbi:MAG: hypothetical protein SGJ24_14610 [Chloroflexota bacterium]|nr:hypothetical protein [Chloroflexota bacterium]
MTALQLRLFGKPSISYEGGRFDIAVKKAIALLAYLATTHRSHSRERLAALLWPDATDEVARTCCAAPAPLDLDRWLYACAEVGILEIDQGRWRFAHDKLREMVLTSLPTVDRATAGADAGSSRHDRRQGGGRVG